MCNVSFQSKRKIVNNNNSMALTKKAINQMRADKSSPASN